MCVCLIECLNRKLYWSENTNTSEKKMAALWPIWHLRSDNTDRNWQLSKINSIIGFNCDSSSWVLLDSILPKIQWDFWISSKFYLAVMSDEHLDSRFFAAPFDTWKAAIVEIDGKWKIANGYIEVKALFSLTTTATNCYSSKVFFSLSKRQMNVMAAACFDTFTI